MTKKKIKKISLSAFNAAAKHSGVQARGREISKAILVDGRTQADVAAEYSISQPAVSRYVNAVWEAHLGFITVTGLISINQKSIFEEWTRNARQELLLKNHHMTED